MASVNEEEDRPEGIPQSLPVDEDLHVLPLHVRLKAHFFNAALRWRNRRCEPRLRRHAVLWRRMEDYALASRVTGASYSDYLTLYQEVRRRKPLEILECGTGISTVVLAQALLDNAGEGAPMGRLTSLEDDRRWFEAARSALPRALDGAVDLVNPGKVDGYYKIFRGVRYDHVPQRPYDFVFSDGPDRHSPVDGQKLFNLDLIDVIGRSERPLHAVVDNHYLTFYILQKVLGVRNARYDPWRRLMFVGPVTREDLRYLRRESFLPDIRALRRTELRLRLARKGRAPFR